jgi:hypothetical protein
MSETALIVPDNLSHNVLARLEEAKTRLSNLANVYLVTEVAETKGVQYAREASGHQSDRYIWRYIKPDRQTLAEAIDELE